MKKYEFNPVIFKAYDIRGKVGSEITSETAYFIGLCMAYKMGNSGRASVGRDVRHHSMMLAASVMQGLLDGGMDVVDIGACPTPVCYFSIPFLKVLGSVMVTGSHNPPDYNGFKITTNAGALSGEELRDFIEMSKSGFLVVKTAGNISRQDLSDFYIEALMKNLEFSKKNLRIGIDAMNGSGGKILNTISQLLPFHFINRNSEMSGDFSRILPEPSAPANIENLKIFLGQEKLDMIFAFDGDADRVLLITPNKVWYGDDLTLLLAHSILPLNHGRKVIFDVKSSFILEEEIAKIGGEPIIYKTGHSLIKQKMQEENAVLAGEMSGHIYINDGKFYPFDDGIYCYLRILEYVTKINQMPVFPHTFRTSEIKIKSDSRLSSFNKIRAALLSLLPVSVLEIDGIKAYFKNSSFLARLSNTEEVIIIRIEAKEKNEFLRLQSVLENLLQTF